MLGRKRRALMWGGLANIAAQLFNLLFADVFIRNDSFENPMLYNFITIGCLMQGLAYHFAYNGQYQNYQMSKPIGLRYFQGSESGIYLVCIAGSSLVFYKGLSLNHYSAFQLCTSIAGFIIACCVKWTTLDNDIQTVHSINKRDVEEAHMKQPMASFADIRLHYAGNTDAGKVDNAEIVPPKSQLSPDDYELNTEEHENFYLQKHILYYLLIFQRCCLESLPQGLFFFIVVVQKESVDLSDARALTLLSTVFVLDFATQLVSAWYFTIFVKNRNPFWYCVIASVTCLFAVLSYPTCDAKAKSLLVCVFMIARRVFITANIHAMILSPIEVGGIELEKYRMTMYSWHTFTWLCAPSLFLWYFNMILISERNITGHKVDVRSITMNEVQRYVWWVYALVLVLCVMSSTMGVNMYWKNKMKVYMQPKASNLFPNYLEHSHKAWQWMK